MELKTFKTNWPLRNPVNILSCLTKTEKAIKGKYQKICTWSLAWKYDLYTSGFSYQVKKDGKWSSVNSQHGQENSSHILKPELVL